MQNMQPRTAGRHKRAALRGLILVFVLDILLAGCIVGGDYLVNYRIPHRLSALNTSTAGIQTALPPAASAGLPSGGTPAGSSSDWGQKFSDKFSNYLRTALRIH